MIIMCKNTTMGFIALFLFTVAFLPTIGSAQGDGYLDGYVYDYTGTPLVGATVTALGTSTYNVDTNSMGHYTLTVPQGSYTVSASKVGYISTSSNQYVNSGLTTYVNFYLYPSCKIYGYVRDSQGAPVNSVQVQLINLSSMGTTTVFTNSSGGYMFDANVPAGNYMLQTSRLGYFQESAQAVLSMGQTWNRDFTIYKQCVVQGYVNNSFGIPIQGAQITFTEQFTGEHIYSITTNSQGFYMLNAVVNGTYNVSVHKDNYAYTNLTLYIAEGVNYQNFVLAQTATIRGWVKNSANAPLVNVRVTVSKPGVSVTDYTDSSGDYICDGLEPGFYSIEAYLNPNCLYTEVGISAYEGATTYKNITLYSNGSARGNVKDATLANVVGAKVEFVNFTSGLIYSNVTDSQGNWNIGGLPVGDYEVTISARLCMSNISSVHINEGMVSTYNVVLRQSGGLVGHVVSQLGTPIEHADVTIYDSEHTVFEMHTNETGYFEQLTDLHGGLYSVLIRPHERYVSRTFENVLVNEGYITTLTFVLNETAYLIGRVTDIDGKGIVGVWVSAFRTSGGYAYASAQTNETGWYNLSTYGLDAGTYEINFAKSGYITQNKTVSVVAGQETRLDVVLLPYITVHGYVLSVAQSGFVGVGGAVVKLTNQTSGAYFVVTTTSDGYYNFTNGLVPGNYAVRIEKIGYMNFTTTITVTNAHLYTNQNFTIVGLGMIQGGVSDETNVPIVGAEVTLIDSVSLDVISIGTTDITGRYLFQNLPPGIYNLKYFKKGYMPLEDSAVVHEKMITTKEVKLIRYLKVFGVTETMTIYSTNFEFSVLTEPFAKINISVNGVLQSTLVASTTGTVPITVNLTRGDNTVSVTSIAEDGSNEDSAVFHIYVALPQLTITYPSNGDELAFGVIQISGSAFDGYGGSNIEVKIRIDSGSWQNVMGNQTWKYYWNVPIEEASKTHTIECMATDGISGKSVATSIRIYVQEILEDRLNISCVKPTKSVEAGKTAVFNLALKNEGKATGNYILNFTMTKNWHARIVHESLNFTLLPNAEPTLVNFEVKIPSGISPGTLNQITITATKTTGQFAGNLTLKVSVTIPIVDNTAVENMNLQLIILVAAIAVIASCAVVAMWFMRRKKEEEEVKFERDARWESMDLDRALRRARDDSGTVSPPPIHYAPDVAMQMQAGQTGQFGQVSSGSSGVQEYGSVPQPSQPIQPATQTTQAWSAGNIPRNVPMQSEQKVMQPQEGQVSQPMGVQTTVQKPEVTEQQYPVQTQVTDKPAVVPLIPKKSKKEVTEVEDKGEEKGSRQQPQAQVQAQVQSAQTQTPQQASTQVSTQAQGDTQQQKNVIPSHVLTQIQTKKQAQIEPKPKVESVTPEPTVKEEDIPVSKTLPATVVSETFYSNPSSNEPYLILEKLKEGKIEVCTQLKPGIYICMTDAGNTAYLALKEMDAAVAIKGVETQSKTEPERNWKIKLSGAGLNIELISKRYDPMGLDIKTAFAISMKIDGKANMIQEFLRQYTKKLGRNPYSKIGWTKFEKEFKVQKNEIEEIWRKYLGL